MIANFHLVLNVVCFLLGNFPASEFYMPTFRNTVSHLHRQVDVRMTRFEICWGIHTGKDLAQDISSQTFSRKTTPTYLKPSHSYTYLPIKMEKSVPKRRHINFRRRGITQKSAHNFLFILFLSATKKQQGSEKCEHDRMNT
jgi:hypothetical protein